MRQIKINNVKSQICASDTPLVCMQLVRIQDATRFFIWITRVNLVSCQNMKTTVERYNWKGWISNLDNWQVDLGEQTFKQMGRCISLCGGLVQHAECTVRQKHMFDAHDNKKFWPELESCYHHKIVWHSQVCLIAGNVGFMTFAFL